MKTSQLSHTTARHQKSCKVTVTQYCSFIADTGTIPCQSPLETWSAPSLFLILSLRKYHLATHASYPGHASGSGQSGISGGVQVTALAYNRKQEMRCYRLLLLTHSIIDILKKQIILRYPWVLYIHSDLHWTLSSLVSRGKWGTPVRCLPVYFSS